VTGQSFPRCLLTLATLGCGGSDFLRLNRDSDHLPSPYRLLDDIQAVGLSTILEPEQVWRPRWSNPISGAERLNIGYADRGHRSYGLSARFDHGGIAL